MNNIFSKLKIKLIFVLVLSFLVVKFLSPQIFLADSPKISPLFIAKLINIPNYVASIPQTISSLFNNSATQDINKVAVKNVPTGLNFSSLSKGVEAAEDTQNNKVYLKIQPGTAYSIEEIEVNGVKKRVLKIYKE